MQILDVNPVHVVCGLSEDLRKEKKGREHKSVTAKGGKSLRSKFQGACPEQRENRSNATKEEDGLDICEATATLLHLKSKTQQYCFVWAVYPH